MKRCAYLLVTVFVVGLFSLTLASEVEATDIFVWMQGISGDSTVMLMGRKGWIEAESMSHQISQSGTMHVGGGGGSGKVQVGDVMLVKRIDKTTPELNLLCSSGKHVDEVIILLTRSTGSQYQTYMEYTLSTVLVTSVRAEAKRGEADTEAVTLHFAKISWKYYADHGAVIEKGWDIEKNTEESPGQESTTQSSGQTKPTYIPRFDDKRPPSRSFRLNN